MTMVTMKATVNIYLMFVLFQVLHNAFLIWFGVSSNHIGLVLLFPFYKKQGPGRLSHWSKVMDLKPLKASLMVSRVVLKIKNTNFINLHHQTHMNRIWSKYFFMRMGH